MLKKLPTRIKAESPNLKSESVPLDASRQRGRLGYNLRLAYLQVQKLFLERMAPHDLRPVDYAILAILEDNENVMQKQLGDALSISPPNLAVVLDRLEKRKLMERLRSERDRRVQTLRLTDMGHQLLAAIEETERGLEIAASSALSDSERSKLISLLQKIITTEMPADKDDTMVVPRKRRRV